MIDSKRMESRIDSIIRFFLYVLIFMLPFSPAAVEICVSFSMVLWFVKRSFRLAYDRGEGKDKKNSSLLKHYLPVKTPINVYIYWFMYACLLSSAGSIYQADSLKACFAKIFEWFIIYFIVLEVMVENKHIKNIFILFCVSSIVLIADGLLQFYFLRKDLFLGRILKLGDRPTAAFKTPSDFGAFVTVFVPVVSTMLLFKSETKKLYFLCILGAIIGFWGLWIIEARAAWMGVILSISIILILKCGNWFMNSINLRKKLVVCFLALAGMIIAVKVFTVFLDYRANSVQWREMRWQSTVKMINDRPIFGHGINTFMRIFQKYDYDAKFNPTYAHNSILQMAAETGMFGLFWFLMMQGNLFFYGYKKLNEKLDENYIQIIALGLLSGAMALFIQSISDTSFQSLQLSALFWYMAGCGMAGIKILHGSYGRA